MSTLLNRKKRFPTLPYPAEAPKNYGHCTLFIIQCSTIILPTFYNTVLSPFSAPALISAPPWFWEMMGLFLSFQTVVSDWKHGQFCKTSNTFYIYGHNFAKTVRFSIRNHCWKAVDHWLVISQAHGALIGDNTVVKWQTIHDLPLQNHLNYTKNVFARFLSKGQWTYGPTLCLSLLLDTHDLNLIESSTFQYFNLKKQHK